LDRNAAPPGGSEESREGGTHEYQRLKPNSVGLIAVVFMAIATAAPITAMTGNVPVAVGFGNGTGAPAGYLVATVVLTLFSVGYIAMSRYITAAGAFYGYISHGLGQVVGMASGLLPAWPTSCSKHRS
jgi:amino acid transporter